VLSVGGDSRCNIERRPGRDFAVVLLESGAAADAAAATAATAADRVGRGSRVELDDAPEVAVTEVVVDATVVCRRNR
jgi:hypothetical protein